MKRYNDSSDSNFHSDNKLDKTESEFPSRCLSISLGELEVFEKKDADFLLNHGKDEPLTLGAQRLKEQFSHMPLCAKKAERSGNAYWNSLASSHFNL